MPGFEAKKIGKILVAENPKTVNFTTPPTPKVGSPPNGAKPVGRMIFESLVRKVLRKDEGLLERQAHQATIELCVARVNVIWVLVQIFVGRPLGCKP